MEPHLAHKPTTRWKQSGAGSDHNDKFSQLLAADFRVSRQAKEAGGTDCPEMLFVKRQQKQRQPYNGYYDGLQATTMRKRKRIAWRRANNGPVLAATILVLIAYELYMQLATDYNNHIYTYHPAYHCRRCLPELVFITPCSAASTLFLTDQVNRTGLISPQQTVIDQLAAGTTLASTILSTTAQEQEQQQQQLNYTKLPADQTVNVTTQSAIYTNSTANELPDSVVINATRLSSQTGDDNSAKRGRSSSLAAPNNKLNHQQHHYHHHHQSTLPIVLCNSRCNCVILEPMMSAVGSNRSSEVVSSHKSGSNRPIELVASGGAEVEKKELANNATGSLNANRQQQQQQKEQLQLQLERAEQALIAFNEDYSLDYEHSSSAANGNGAGLDDTGAPDTGEPALANGGTSNGALLATNSGNSDHKTTTTTMAPTKITNSLGPSADQNYSGAREVSEMAQANNPKPLLIERGNNGNKSSSGEKEAQGQGERGGGGGSSSTTNPSDVLVVSGSSRQAQLQPQRPEASRNATSPSTTTNASNNNDSDNDTGSGSIKTALPQLQQQQQQQQQQQPGMTLFPLPTHLHGLLRAHHHPLHQHQPLGPGNGRDATGPQLYAQSLYSSQAPKLSYHAHTPYLKSQVQSAGDWASVLMTGPNQQQQPTQTEGQQQLAAPPGAGGYSAQSMRSPYLGHHHLRKLQPNGAARSQPLPVASSTANEYAPMQQARVLVALKTLNMSGKLKWPTTTTTQSTQETINLHESPQLVASVEAMLIASERDGIQSLVLRDNELQFELWSELYALLAVQMRQHLFHIDLSHNALAKLGITFTGYIEHHLAVHGSWPFTATNQPSSSNQSSLPELASVQQTVSTKQAKLQANRLTKHGSLLSGGKLYTLIQQRLVQAGWPTPIASAASSNHTGQWQQQQVASSANLSHVSFLQQPLLVKALDLSHNKLKWLINDQFRALKYVQTIRLDHNRIRYIHQHAFSGLESLRFLNLNFNRLQVIYIEQFQTNYNLLALMLRSNYLAYLRGGSFASLANLKRLDISSNKLTILSNNAFIGLESLELLNCSSNQFVHAPSASLHPLTSLKRLDLSDNLIAQLAPGTFFHLPLEELILNQNEQLVSIDRGAFWDLPYLQRLHLRSNPMLSEINSQAFVGTQNLQTISVEDCQSLDEDTKQMLENVTMTATSRLLLKNEQSKNSGDQNSGKSVSSIELANSSNATGGNATAHSMKTSHFNESQTAQETQQSNNNKGAHLHTTTYSRHFMNRFAFEGSGIRLQTCFYYLGTVALLMVALKLVFKYTSTSHYMEARRRRRRVFEMNKGIGEIDFETEDSESMSNGSASNSLPMCVQPNSHMLNGALNLRSQQNRISHRQPETDRLSLSDNADIDRCASGANDDANSISYDSVNALPDQTDSVPSDIGQQQQQELPAEHNSILEALDECSNDISDVINSSTLANETLSSMCCPGCSSLQINSGHIDIEGEGGGGQQVSNVDGSNQLICCEMGDHVTESAEHQHQMHHLQHGTSIAGNQTTQSATIDLIHSQLIAAGFDYGHANCAHFYQSLGPALQFADMTANFVGNMDFY